MLLRDAHIFVRALQNNHCSQTHLIELGSLAVVFFDYVNFDLIIAIHLIGLADCEPRRAYQPVTNLDLVLVGVNHR